MRPGNLIRSPGVEVQGRWGVLGVGGVCLIWQTVTSANPVYPLALFGFSRVSIVIHERFYRFFLEGTQFVLRVHHLKTDHDTLFK